MKFFIFRYISIIVIIISFSSACFAEIFSIVANPGDIVDSTNLDDCNDKYFPKYENASLNSLPIQVMISKIDGEWAVAPAAGLNVYGVWWNFIRPKCEDIGNGKFLIPKNYSKLSGIFSLAADYVVFPTKETTINTNGQTEKKDSAEGGLLANIKLGIFKEWKWIGGDHGNRVALGVIASWGYLFPSTTDGGGNVLSIGPAIDISIW